jgi:1-acyl-sn-glycerol-3-phosphate acyltransferase
MPSLDMKLRVPGDPWLYAFARILLVAAVRGYGRFCEVGAERLPARGPAIVVANHPSDVDPILLGVTFPRTLHFLADVVQFRRGFVGPIIKRLAAIPIHKGRPDRAALEQALAVLAAGGVVCLFAEGDLYRGAAPAPFRAGVGLLAVRSGAPVVPVGISGAERLWAGGRVHRPWIRLSVGEPRSYAGLPRRRSSYERVAAELREAVVRLRDERPSAWTPLRDERPSAACSGRRA